MQILLARRRSARRAARRGTALVMALISIGALSTMSLALLTVSVASTREQRSSKERIHTSYIAEAGLTSAVVDLQTGGTGILGSQQAVQPLGSGGYWVVREDEPLAQIVTLTSTAVEDRAGSRIELTLHWEINSIWWWAAFGDESTKLSSQAMVDSYDSTLGTYASQADNFQYGIAYADVEGAVASNGSISLDQNAHVFGDASCGPEGTTQVLNPATVSGSTTPAPEAVDLPPIVVPTYPLAGNLTVNTTAVLGAGNYHYNDLLLRTGAQLTVFGPANIVLTNFTMRSNAKFLVDATAGPVRIWVYDDFTMSSNTLLASTDFKASAVEINLLSDNVIDPNTIVDLDVIALNSGSMLYGTIYAPNAAIEIDSDFQLYGAMVARTIDLASNCRIHYDAALVEERDGDNLLWTRIATRTLPFQP
jgi:hypothetical protein